MVFLTEMVLNLTKMSLALSQTAI